MSYILERNVGGASGSSDQEQDKVPDNWVLKKLGEILNIERGSVITKSACSPGQVPVVAGGKTPAYYHNLANRKGPTITISASGANAGYISYYEMPIFASDCSTISEGVNYDLRFVYFFLLSRQSELYAAQKGGAQPHVNPRDVQALSFMQPSLLEQTTIANILSDQEALVAHYNDLIALHEKRFAYLSDELLSGRLRLVKNLSSEIELVKNEEWQESTLNGDRCQFPVGWFIKALGNIAKTVTGHTPSTSNKTYWNENSGTPWFSTPDLRQNVKGYITNTSRYLTEQGAQVARVYPAKTLLVSCIATIGEVGLLPEDGAFNQQINGILPNAQIDTNYLRLWFIYKTSDFKRFAPTSVVSIINKSLFNTFEVIMPPLEEQTLIANVLSDQEALIAEYKKLRDAEKKRFDWLSDALLSGTYRVKVEA